MQGASRANCPLFPRTFPEFEAADLGRSGGIVGIGRVIAGEREPEFTSVTIQIATFSIRNDGQNVILHLPVRGLTHKIQNARLRRETKT